MGYDIRKREPSLVIKTRIWGIYNTNRSNEQSQVSYTNGSPAFENIEANTILYLCQPGVKHFLAWFMIIRSI